MPLTHRMPLPCSPPSLWENGSLLPSLQRIQYGSFSYKKMTIMEAVGMLDDLVDESDPDVDFPNSFHAFQTAEGIRKAHPDKGVPLQLWWGRCSHPPQKESRGAWSSPAGPTLREADPWAPRFQRRACSAYLYPFRF